MFSLVYISQLARHFVFFLRHLAWINGPLPIPVASMPIKVAFQSSRDICLWCDALKHIEGCSAGGVWKGLMLFTRRNSNLKDLRESCIDSLFYCGQLMNVTETLPENVLGANCPFIALNSIWGVTSSLIPQYLRERSSSHHPRVAGFLSSGSHTSSLSLAQFCEGLSSPIAFHRIVKHQAQQELSVEFHCFFFWFNVNLSKNAHGPWCISVSLGDEVKMCLVLISGPSRGQLKTHYVRRAFEKPHSWSLAGIRHFQK